MSGRLAAGRRHTGRTLPVVHRILAVVVALAALAGCSRGGSGDEAARTEQAAAREQRAALEPAYPPVSTTVPDAPAAPRRPNPAGESTTTIPPVDDNHGSRSGEKPSIHVLGGAEAVASRSDHVRTGRISDAAGDVTASAEQAPKWADLTRGVLSRTGEGFELRVRAADRFPDRAPDADRAMNVASFFDVDGDGSLDYEIWLDLAERGWSARYFDHRAKTAAHQEKSGVTVTVAAGTLVARFPLSHLRGAETLRWSLASEWGRHEVLGTAAAARDDAPDDDRPSTFPS